MDEEKVSAYREARANLESIKRAVEAVHANPERRMEILKEDWGYKGCPEDTTRGDALEALNALVLGISYRSSWQADPTNLYPVEYCITLGYGGPTVQVEGDIRPDGTVKDASLLYSAQGVSQESLSIKSDDRGLLMEFANYVIDYIEPI